MSEEKMHKTVNSYKVAIIGAGRIGAFFDSPQSEDILTHAHACLVNPDTELVGFVDVNEDAGKRATSMWGGKYYKSVGQLFSKEQVDIVIVCTPDEFHYDVVKEVLEHKPKVVVLEKPVAKTFKEAEDITKLAKEKEVPVVINYIRRFDPVMHHVKNDITSEKYGKVLGGMGMYAKGIKYGGSHLVDLMQFLFGKVKSAEPFYSLVDYKEEDPSISAIFKLQNCPQFSLMAGDERACDIYEFDILLEKARIRFVESGFRYELYEVKEDKKYKGFYDMFKTSEKNTSLDKACLHLLENVVNHLQSGEPLQCTVEEGTETQRICEQLINQLEKNINK